jgi:hypothetical protein
MMPNRPFALGDHKVAPSASKAKVIVTCGKTQPRVSVLELLGFRSY